MNYYVYTTGNDSNTGGLADPFASPAKALSVATSGDIINIASGTYNITSQLVVPIGVSMQGTGDSTILLSTVAGEHTILLESNVENTNGAQYLRSFKLDGSSFTAYGGILVNHRGNVNINLLRVVDFDYYGVSFRNSEPPAVYATNNKFNGNIVTACAGYHGGSQGCLEIGGQDGLEIGTNIIDADRAGANVGDAIYGVEGYIKNVKINLNTITKTYIPGTSLWDFAIEIWDWEGGNEIWDNTITGSIDVGGYSNYKGSSSYSVYIHDNIIGQASLLSAEPIRGVLIESSSSDVIVSRNLIKNVCAGIYFSQVQSGRVVTNIQIDSNVFYNIGHASVNSKGWGILWTDEALHDHTVNNIKIWNNAFIGATSGGNTMWGMNLPNIGACSNVSVRNNIIVNFDQSPIFCNDASGDVTLDILSIENNSFYNNGNGNAILYSGLTPTNTTIQNNLTSDPLFVSGSDFHLQAGSPARGTGINVGLYTDNEGNAWNNPPSRGAYEYGGTPPDPPPLVPVTDIDVTSAGPIATANGTSQCTVVVSPGNASNQLVNWSISLGTGYAVVSPSGLVTALKNGSVTVRATAQDGSGVYGEVVILITGQTVVPPVPLTGLRDRDGNPYTTTIIGSREWLIENLKTTHYADGSAIQNLTDCSNPNGAFYNWFAATDVRNIANTGAHVPSQAELEAFYAAIDANFLIRADVIKEIGTDYWDAGNLGTNSIGFNLKGSGWRNNSGGQFEYIKQRTVIWSSTEWIADPTAAYGAKILYNESYISPTAANKRDGHIIRLVMDSTILSDGETGTYTGNDGRVYNTICIGGVEYLSENLEETKYRNGDLITEVTDDATWSALATEGMCWYNNISGGGWVIDTTGAYVWYDNLIANKDRGAKYNWYAVNNASGLAYLTRNGVRETGWRVALVADYDLLKSHPITADDTTITADEDEITADYIGTDTSLNLKEVGTTHWTAGDGLDTYGFKAIGSGIRNFANCVFSGLKLIEQFWTSEAADASTAYAFLIDDSDPAATTDAKEKNYGFSVRLVRDYDPNNPEPPDPPDPPVPPVYPLVIPYNYGPLPVYRFYISTAFTGSALSFEVFPLKFLSTTIVSEKEKTEAFYRKKFSGSLLFGTNSKVTDVFGIEQNRRDDWLLFWGFEQIDPEQKLYLTITKDFGGFIDTYWEGYFATSEGKFDIDNCTFEVTPLVIDDYTNFLDGADVEYNFLGDDGVPAMGTVSAVIAAGPLAGTYNFTRMRFLCKIGSDNILEWLAKKLCGIGVVVTSDFFTNATNPITLTDNHLLNLTIAQKSDITRYTSTDPATTALISWNQLMEILYVMFDVQWSYDLLTNTISLEHIKEFTHPAGIDLRNQLSCVATNKYSYLKEKMPKYESFSFMEANGVNFIGTPIYYDSGGVNQNPDSNSSDATIPVTTDIEYIISCIVNGGNIADEGFVILCNDLNAGVYSVRGDFGRLDNSFYALNMDLSVANLQHSYHKYERVLPTGYMNGILTTFYSARKTKQQECTAILCEELDPNAEITTELGETYFGGAKAIVKSASLSPTGETKFQLLYGPIPTLNPGVPDDIFGVTAYPSLTSFSVPDDEVDIKFVFNKACPGDYNVRVQEIVYDNTGMVHASGPWEGMTFLTGTLEYSFTPTYLHQIAAGWSVRLHFEYTGSEIDIFRGVDPPPMFMWMFPSSICYEYTIL